MSGSTAGAMLHPCVLAASPACFKSAAPGLAGTQLLATEAMVFMRAAQTGQLHTVVVSLRRSGVQIKEIRDISGSHIKILPPDELPPCALSNDRVVQCAPAFACIPHTLMPVEGLMPSQAGRAAACH